MTTVIIILGICVVLGFSWFGSVAGAEMNELGKQIGKLREQLNETRTDLETVTASLVSVQREMAKLKPKYPPDEYYNPDIVVSELSASEKEKQVSQIKIMLCR